MTTRRKSLQIITYGSLAAAAGSLPWSRAYSQSPSTTTNPLHIPPLDEGVSATQTGDFVLNVQKGQSQFLPGLSTDTLGINGNYLGPTLSFTHNQPVSLSVNNQLSEPTTLHWHGFHLPASEDGGPRQEVAAGASWTANFKVVQGAGCYWYHSHLKDRAGTQVYHGLAGMILVRDNPGSDDLPSTYGVDDIPLIIQDRRFNNEGQFVYMNRYEDMVVGMHGDQILVNGTWNPVFAPSTRLVRFRLLNAANARSFHFAFSDNRPFNQIASDGGLLEKPLTMNRLVLAVGERAEIVVDFSDGQTTTLLSLAEQSTFPQFPGAMSEMMRALHNQAFEILQVQPQSSLDENAAVPAQLTNIDRIPEASADNSRRFQLSMGAGMRSGNDSGPGTGARNGQGGGHGGGNFSINGRRMAEDYINARIQLNTTEIWELSNNSPMMHPFHVHNGQFQILDRNGTPPPANEMGWKDTVKVNSGERVRIIMQFSDFADAETPYMYHCHILEHEDRGMMGQFLVVE